MIYHYQIDFKIPQFNSAGKAEECKGMIRVPVSKKYGEFSMKTPWGENYKGLVNTLLKSSGYAYSEQGNAINVNIFLSNTLGGHVNVTPLNKEKPQTINGVITGVIHYQHEGAADPHGRPSHITPLFDKKTLKEEKKLEEEIIARGQTETKK